MKRLGGLLALAVVVAGLTIPAVSASAAPAATAPTVTSDDLWTSTTAKPRASERRVARPEESRGFRLDRDRLQSRLEAATTARSAGGRLAVPAPDGTLVEFDFRQTQVMEPGLAKAHPETTTYAGSRVGDPTTSIRFDDGPLGFHASVRSSDGSTAWYVDPATVGPDGIYLSYDADDPGAATGARDFAEPEADLPDRQPGTTDAERRSAAQAGEQRRSLPEPGAAVSLRTYRLALVNEPDYARYFAVDGVPSDDTVLAAKTALVNRLNQVYGTDLGLHLVLVEGSDRLNLDTDAKAVQANGPCGPTACFTTRQATFCDSSSLVRNRFVLGQLIGASAYDIGHLVMGDAGGGGGLAQVAGVGGFGKGWACTGIYPPTGDGYGIDYVAHEIGHQLGADHTFDGTTGFCGSSRSLLTAVEPGSGSSIMGYAGICGADSLQEHSDPSFSQRSIEQIQDVVSVPNDFWDSEVQSVTLAGFGAGDSFTLTFDGRTTTPITYEGYTRSAIRAALRAIVPDDADVYVDPLDSASGGSFGRQGFDVTFADSLGYQDVALMTIQQTGFTDGRVAEIDRGGEPTNQGTVTTSANHHPEVSAADDRTIPVRTPFALTGTATDPDDDPLTYSWEQNDVGGFSGHRLADQARRDGPLFRVFGTASTQDAAGSVDYGSPGSNRPGADPTRVFPDLAQVLDADTNARTGVCPTTSGAATTECLSELLPTSSYVGFDDNASPARLTFRLTARDGRDADGGGVAHDDTVLTLDRTAGPLLVGKPRPADNQTAGGTGTVTWTVNGTDKAGLAPQVEIRLSTDDGQTWPTVLADSTPNDGSAEVTWPAGVDTQTARVKVSAVDNYFFAVSDTAFPIGAAPGTTIADGPKNGAVVTSRTVSFTPGSSVEGSTFECSLDGAAFTACPSPLTYDDLTSRTHTLAVRAVADGVADPSPITRTWTVPVGSDAMTIAKGPWSRLDGKAAFDGRYARSSTKGAKLSYRMVGASGIDLVVTKYAGAGSVDVYSAGRLLKTVNLSTRTTCYRCVVPITTFTGPTTAGVGVVVRSSGKNVRVEGVALRSD